MERQPVGTAVITSPPLAATDKDGGKYGTVRFVLEATTYAEIGLFKIDSDTGKLTSAMDVTCLSSQVRPLTILNGVFFMIIIFIVFLGFHCSLQLLLLLVHCF